MSFTLNVCESADCVVFRLQRKSPHREAEECFNVASRGMTHSNVPLHQVHRNQFAEQPFRFQEPGDADFDSFAERF
jgi:hypothetical protein